MKPFILTVDCEEDLHNGKYEGVVLGLKRLEKVCDKCNIKPTLFVTPNCLNKFTSIFKNLKDKNWEIALHFHGNDLKSINIQDLPFKFKGFKKGQHKIKEEELDLLGEYGFEYDDSYIPRSFLELKHFFKKANPYKIRKNLIEVPVSSFGLVLGGITLRLFPLFLNKLLFNFLLITRKVIVMEIHSWDLIEMPQSKCYRICPLNKFIIKLEKLLYYINKKTKNITLEKYIGNEKY